MLARLSPRKFRAEHPGYQCIEQTENDASLTHGMRDEARRPVIAVALPRHSMTQKGRKMERRFILYACVLARGNCRVSYSQERAKLDTIRNIRDTP
jgi:hypothetical protein